MQNNKICTSCKQEYPATAKYFAKHRRNKDGLRYYCKKCESNKFREWWLKSHYGINTITYNEIFVEQQGCCAICGKHQSNIKRTLDVDHNHETGEVRGLLCYDCNRLLGCAKENINILQSAIKYLNTYDSISKPRTD